MKSTWKMCGMHSKKVKIEKIRMEKGNGKAAMQRTHISSAVRRREEKVKNCNIKLDKTIN